MPVEALLGSHSIEPMSTSVGDGSQSHSSSEVDGVYVTCRECQEHWREVLQLEGGRFRYWYWTQNMGSAPSQGPVTGTFKVSEDWLAFSDGAPSPLLRFARLKNTRLLITEEGVQTWNDVQKIYPHTGYFEVSGLQVDPDAVQRPSFVEFNAE